MVVRLLLALLTLTLLGGCHAAGIASMHIANDMASLGPYRLVEDLAYGPDPANRLDLYIPDEAIRQDAPRVPVVVFFHGGDWSEQYPAKEIHRFFGDALAARGIATAIVNYRRYPTVRFPAFIEDGADAFVWLHEHVRAYGGDPDRMFVMGHSAGAHTAAMLAMDKEYILDAGGEPAWVRGLIGMAGPYVFPANLAEPELVDIFGLPRQHRYTQVVNYVDDQGPPALLLAGGSDERVPLECTQYMARSMREHGVNVHVKVYPSLTHVMLLGVFAPPLRLWHSPANDVSKWVWQRAEQLDAIDRKPPTFPLSDEHLVTTPVPAGRGG